MLSKHLTNVIQNLEKKKFRDKYNLFKTEGEKLVGELLLSDLKIDTIVAYPEWIDRHPRISRQCRTIEVNEIEMKTLFQFQIFTGSDWLWLKSRKTYQPEKSATHSL